MYCPPYGFTAHHHREAEKPSFFPCPPWQIYYTIQSLIADAVPIYPPAPWLWLCGCLVGFFVTMAWVVCEEILISRENSQFLKEFLRSSHLFAMLFFDEIHPLLWILIRCSLSHIVTEIWDPKEHHPPFLFAGHLIRWSRTFQFLKWLKWHLNAQICLLNMTRLPGEPTLQNLNRPLPVNLNKSLNPRSNPTNSLIQSKLVICWCVSSVGLSVCWFS